MQYFQSLQFLNLLNFLVISVLILIGCDKKKPPKSAENTKKNSSESPNPNPPPSSHMYVDVTCQPKSVAITTKPTTKPVTTATSKMKTRSMNPYVKTKSIESPKEKPPKDMVKEMEKLREEASKEGGAKKEEEDFGYENCGDMTEDQLKKMKAKEAQKRKTPGKAPIVYKKPEKYHVKKYN